MLRVLADATPVSAVADRRANRRIQVFLSVEIEGPSFRSGRIVDLSKRGARVKLDAPLNVDEEVVLRRGALDLRARVAWCKGTMAGLRFSDPMHEGIFLQLSRGAA